MDNENMNNQEQENTLTPEEKVQKDIGEKIADAAEPIQDEIDEANGVVNAESEGSEESEGNGEQSGLDESWSDEAWEEAGVEEVKPEPVKVTMKRSNLILSLIASLLVGALLCFAGMQIPAAIKNRPEGSTVATVSGEKITDLDVRYYIYAEASNYANKNNISQSDLATYDWDQEVDGAKLSDTIREKAVDDAIDEVLTIKKGEENGVKLDDATKSQITSQVSSLQSTYGEDGLTLRARTMGISSAKQYSKMYEKVMTTQSVQEDIEKNPSKYYPENTDDLKDYKQDNKASVKHILIKASGTDENALNEAQAKAQAVLDRLNNGEDFDAVMKDANEDTGEPDTGYTFGEGEMDEAFEKASFELGLGEVSGLVKSTYGYHIIKRVPGMYELQAYWRAQDAKNIKINKGKLAKLSVKDIMADVVAASEELQSEQSSSTSSGSSSSSK